MERLNPIRKEKKRKQRESRDRVLRCFRARRQRMANEQINVPSLVVILVLSGLIVRYLFFSPSAPPQQQRPSRDSASVLRSREAAAERILQMFPQVDRRTVLWDLQRTGGSIAATTERILAGRLETVGDATPLFPPGS